MASLRQTLVRFVDIAAPRIAIHHHSNREVVTWTAQSRDLTHGSRAGSGSQYGDLEALKAVLEAKKQKLQV